MQYESHSEEASKKLCAKDKRKKEEENTHQRKPSVKEHREQIRGMNNNLERINKCDRVEKTTTTKKKMEKTKPTWEKTTIK